jgi:hypothetical protein
VALGASNLTRGLPTLVGLARARWGRDTELFAALGLGRSYGATSRVLVRALPGLLQCGLWSALVGRPKVTTRALVTDVGNDILYGSPPAEILDWVEACVDRLQTMTDDIVVTDLPIGRLRRLSRLEFAAFRTVFYPPCRLSFAEVMHTAEQVSEGLVALAGRRGLRAVRLERDWYGLDPIHIRPSQWGTAWGRILDGSSAPVVLRGKERSRMSVGEALRLYAMRPERERLLGIERVTAQRGAPLPGGGRVWLY